MEIANNMKNSHLPKLYNKSTVLKSAPATNNGIITENPQIVGTIHRADVAQLVCRCLNSDHTNNKIFSAIDRNMIYPGLPEFVEFNLD